MSAPSYVGGAVKSEVYDPLRFCIFTTIALLAWATGPAIVLIVMSAIGLAAYLRAWHQGLRTTKCFLRDPRIAMAYLGLTLGLGILLLARGA